LAKNVALKTKHTNVCFRKERVKAIKQSNTSRLIPRLLLSWLPPVTMMTSCSNLLPMSFPRGCDTFVAFPPTTSEGLVVFGKNSDRPAGESQSIRRYPATRHFSSPSPATAVQCTYITIPQVPLTHAVLISQINWMWGCENGANEHGVVIGNEAVWTRVPEEPGRRLLGMDLVRLGLERSTTAREGLDVITSLLEEHGQGGPCAENDDSFTYHNSFLLADRTEAWILETAGRHWVAECVTSGSRNISNNLTIRTSFHLSSKGIRDYALKHKLWNGNEPFDFAACFSDGGVELCPRQLRGSELLQQHENKGSFDRNDMISILRDHESGICMHGGFETTASMISELRADGTVRHWMTGQPFPCKSEFEEQQVMKK
jgi:secernin